MRDDQLHTRDVRRQHVMSLFRSNIIITYYCFSRLVSPEDDRAELSACDLQDGDRLLTAVRRRVPLLPIIMLYNSILYNYFYRLIIIITL